MYTQLISVPTDPYLDKLGVLRDGLWAKGQFMGYGGVWRCFPYLCAGQLDQVELWNLIKEKAGENKTCKIDKSKMPGEDDRVWVMQDTKIFARTEKTLVQFTKMTSRFG